MRVQAKGSTTYLSDNGFPINFLENVVNSPIVQRKLKSRWKWEVWDVVPGTHSYQVYIFNVTNPHDVEKGAKPSLQQIGPYFYHEKRLKFDVSINLDLTVNFERNYTYTFDPSKSSGSEDDLVNIPNLPLIIFSTIASEVNPMQANDAVNDLTSQGESLISKGVRVGDLLFRGMDVSKYRKHLKLFGNDTSESRQLLVDEFASGRYGILTLKNGAHELPFVVDSGLKKQDKVGQIVSWNGLNKLNWWKGDRCNQINGSDSSVFAPYQISKTALQVFDLDLCRSISFRYSKDMLFHNVVAGMTYNIAEETLEDPKVFAPNMCFCRGVDNCLKKGVLDVSPCRGGPYVMSYANFLNADPEYLKAVDGLKPKSGQHQTQIDFEPVTGAVINYRKRFQWNIWLKPLPHVDYFKNLSPIIFPVIWNDDNFQLNPDKAKLLEEELASQLGGVGDVASELLNRLAQNGAAGFCTFHNHVLIIFSITTTLLLSLSSSSAVV
ncbi:sensory neuron membrane protein 1 isoform X2 [Folsomia candida]|uniref:sensory neuron membrane protein 1 isoform X2 n=1 Tax=Folsomia candida TaxID=158441 RepID=UPI000B8FE4C5|nr:sensory neuron membrane protein 1 isoform X2 [Folsomia candida]